MAWERLRENLLWNMEKYVYHYTSTDALRGILGKEVTLWATRYDQLNDPYEKVWAEDIALEYIQSSSKAGDITTDNLRNFMCEYPYILSLCMKPDYRNMWRLYANDGEGVCLVLRENVIKRYSMTNQQKDAENTFDIYAPLKYATEKNRQKTLLEIYDKLKDSFIDEDKERNIMKSCAFVKHIDFKMEKEIRYARIRSFEQSTISYEPKNEDRISITSKENQKDVKYRMRGHTIVPYFDITFPSSVLSGIIVGYKYKGDAFENVKKYIENLIQRHHGLYENLNVTPSSLK